MAALRAGLLLIVTLASHAAYAQDADCERLLKTGIPYELHLSQERFFAANPSQTIPTVRQVHRGTKNLKIVYTKQASSIFRTINYGPFTTELILNGTRVLSTTEYSGIDIRSPPPLNTNYSYAQTVQSTNGAREQFSIKRSYRGSKTITIGKCRIGVVSAFTETRGADGSVRATSESDYSPDLQEFLYSSATDSKSGVVVVSTAKEIRTEFTPFEKQ